MARQKSNLKFRIRLRDAHDALGLSPYMVAKRTGLSASTVRKYADVDEVISEYVPPAVVTLANFYGVDWRSTSIVEVIPEGDDAPETETPVAPAA